MRVGRGEVYACVCEIESGVKRSVCGGGGWGAMGGRRTPPTLHPLIPQPSIPSSLIPHPSTLTQPSIPVCPSEHASMVLIQLAGTCRPPLLHDPPSCLSLRARYTASSYCRHLNPPPPGLPPSPLSPPSCVTHPAACPSGPGTPPPHTAGT